MLPNGMENLGKFGTLGLHVQGPCLGVVKLWKVPKVRGTSMTHFNKWISWVCPICCMTIKKNYRNQVRNYEHVGKVWLLMISVLLCYIWENSQNVREHLGKHWTLWIARLRLRIWAAVPLPFGVNIKQCCRTLWQSYENIGTLGLHV